MGSQSDKVIFNPFFNKSPRGANQCESNITINVMFPSHFVIWDLCLIIENDAGSIEKEMYFNDSITFQVDKEGIYWYYFSFKDCYGTHYLVSNDNLDAKISNVKDNFWQLSINPKLEYNPSWFDGKIMYQIMVDRFYQSGQTYIKKEAIMHSDWYENPYYKPVIENVWNNDFFGGNLQGIIAKLSYLKSLNIDVIYLNPIFEAFSNHKYDTGDYLKIDKMFGNEEDFVELCAQAKKMGIKIIIDGVFNHTGSDSIYFNKEQNYSSIGAYNSKESVYYDWYKFISYPDDYLSWWGIKTLPAVNQNSASYRNFIKKVLTKWLTLGASGVRLDVVDELDQDFVEYINNVVKAIGNDNIIIGEVWEDASNKIAYGMRRHYFNGKQLDSVMNYVFMDAIIAYLKCGNVEIMRNTLRKIINNYPKHILDKLMNIVDTHDVKRIINNFYYNPNMSLELASTYYPSKEEFSFAWQKMKMATILQFTLPGVPCIYYGDEAGLSGNGDALSRKCYPWGRENEEVFAWYKTLTTIRKQYQDVFSNGEYQEVSSNDSVFCFLRTIEKKQILVIVNNTYNDYSSNVKGLDLLKNEQINQLFLPPQTGAIIYLN